MSENFDEALSVLVDSMPVAMHNTVHISKAFKDSPYTQLEVMEAALWVDGGVPAMEECLQVMADGINEYGRQRPDWSCLILDACANFDVEMVRELLASGVRADRLYMTIDGDPWDLVSWTLQAYHGRSHAFKRAPSLWADKCAEIVEMLISVGGTRLVAVWLGPELAPVLASRFLSGTVGGGLQGAESWPEIQKELGIGDGACWASVVLTLMVRPGVLQFSKRRGDPAAKRFAAAVDAWYATFDDGCEDGAEVEV